MMFACPRRTCCYRSSQHGEEFLVAEAVDLSQSGMFVGGEEVTLACVGDLVGVRFEVAGELARAE